MISAVLYTSTAAKCVHSGPQSPAATSSPAAIITHINRVMLWRALLFSSLSSSAVYVKDFGSFPVIVCDRREAAGWRQGVCGLGLTQHDELNFWDIQIGGRLLTTGDLSQERGANT